MILWQLVLLFCFELVASIVGLYIFFHLATKFQIQATLNYRSLHSRVVPRGGGIVIAISTSLGVSGIYFQHYLSLRSFITFLLGAVIGTIIGFLDDVVEIKAAVRLCVQIILALIIVIYAKLYPSVNQHLYLVLAKLCGSALLVFCIVWFFNAFNFIDGADGMATASVVYISSVIGVVLLFKHQYAEALFCFALLLSSLVFLYFNWPPAKVFLGDAGSFFLGYTLCFLIIDTVLKGLLPTITWLVLFAYYLSDTTLTTFVRFLTLSHWYRPHRSHAYQNLARIWNSHLKVLSMVLGINLFWLLPLALLTLLYPNYRYVQLLLAYVPICLFVLKKGPLYQDK